MAALIQELNVTEDLKKCGVTRLAKETSRVLLEYHGKSVTIFDIEDNELFATLQDFEDSQKVRLIVRLKKLSSSVCQKMNII